METIRLLARLGPDQEIIVGVGRSATAVDSAYYNVPENAHDQFCLMVGRVQLLNSQRNDKQTRLNSISMIHYVTGVNSP